MKSLKQIVLESLTYVGDTPTYEPTAKGEKDFVKLHTDSLKVHDYPVEDSDDTFKANNIKKDETHQPNKLVDPEHLQKYLSHPALNDEYKTKNESILKQLNTIIESDTASKVYITENLHVELTPDDAREIYDIVLEHAINGSVDFDTLYKSVTNKTKV